MQYAQTVQTIIKTISSGQIKIKYLRILKDNYQNNLTHDLQPRVKSTISSTNAGFNQEKIVKAKQFYETVS